LLIAGDDSIEQGDVSARSIRSVMNYQDVSILAYRR
jgi:hypothetical protein